MQKISPLEACAFRACCFRNWSPFVLDPLLNMTIYIILFIHRKSSVTSMLETIINISDISFLKKWLMSLFRLEYPNTQALMKHRVIN